MVAHSTIRGRRSVNCRLLAGPSAAVEAYLDHLRVERRLAAHTLTSYARDLRALARNAAQQLVDRKQASQFSDVIELKAGPDKDVRVLFQKITHYQKDPGNPYESRESFVIYFNGGEHAQALHIVPGKASNSKTQSFIKTKILPAFELNG